MTGTFLYLLPLLFLFHTSPATGTPSPTFLQSTKLNPTQKLSHFLVYWHDILSGSNPTSVNIIPPLPTNKPTKFFPSLGFGMVNMIDDPLTEKPEPGSRLLGRAQGFYGLASQEEVGLLMAMNFVFSTGKYNGSTLTIFGRNSVFEKVREMPVIGGSGLFRFATGYAQATTHWFDAKTGDAIIQYDLHVLHY